MNCSFSRSRFRWIRKLCSLVCAVAGCCTLPQAHAQEIDKPLQTIDEEITAFAYAPDGRIVYAVRRLMKTKRYDLQRDDISLQGLDGKRRRIVSGEKLVRGNAPFSYTVNSFRWSPDGHFILAELFTTAVTDAEGTTRDEKMTLLLDESGKEIRIAGADSVIPGGFNAWWLTDNTTVVYLTEALKPNLLFSFNSVRPVAGRGGALFAGRTFLDAAAIPRTNAGVAVERDRALSGPPRLQRLEMIRETDAELATLDSYSGGIQVSPGGSKVAYYLDHEVLEIRDLTAPDRLTRLRVGFGDFQWTPDEKRILLKRAPEKKSGDLVWIDVPPLAAAQKSSDGTSVAVLEPVPRSILFGLSFRDFAISPDGRFLAIVPPGKRNLAIYPLPR
ncbi:MAG: hypothetical protein AUI53_02465 [Acidobacteria bacterium 13_1_40CM_2_60_7]|nr:MAG: hypothetical protein AUI53_02465 [Acidobacteria bacterium 13_1_40CM_2_60_7]